MSHYAIAGKRVKDADKPRRVTVHTPDVDEALQCQDDCCAIAIAIRKQNNVLSARVTDSFTLIESEKEWTRYKTPKEARTALALFDLTKVMIPQTFVLQPVRGVRRLENRAAAVRRHLDNVEAGTSRVTHARGRSHTSMLARIPGVRPAQASVRIEMLP